MSAEIRAAIKAALQVQDMTVTQVATHVFMLRSTVYKHVKRMENESQLCRAGIVREMPRNSLNGVSGSRTQRNVKVIGREALLYSLDMSRANPMLICAGHAPVVVERRKLSSCGLVDAAIANRNDVMPRWLGGKA